MHEALTQLGWQADPTGLVRRLARLNMGLPSEDEFSVVCTWLGRCKLIHKLDQRQGPVSSRIDYQVPDLLAIFDYKGRSIPVLIEVKSSVSQTLSFQPDYFLRLRSYASAIGLPILIAWKYQNFWMLFEIDHMTKAKKNYNIALGKAATESLLGVLAGDFSYSLAKGSGLHLSMRKDKLVSETGAGSELQQEWSMVIEDVCYTDGQGSKRHYLSPDVQRLFFINSLDETTEHSESHVYGHFVVGQDATKFAHMSLTALIGQGLAPGQTLNWRDVTARSTAVPGFEDFSRTIKRALDEKIVTHIFHIQPQTLPRFLVSS
jgi:Holliday junction resolvase